jgi:hypothetical protein
MIVICGIYFWISNRWKSEFTVKQMESYGKIINETVELPENIYRIYDRLEPSHRHLTMNRELFRIIAGLTVNKDYLEMNRSPFHDIYWLFEFPDTFSRNDWKIRYNHYFFAWGLSKFTTPEKCFDYLFTRQIENLKMNESYIKSHSQILNTKLENLTDNEILELYLLLKAPTFYNKYLHPDRFERRMNELKKTLN